MTEFEFTLRFAVSGDPSARAALMCWHECQNSHTARIKARDKYLCEAASNLRGNNPCNWTLAGKLAAAVKRFESCLWRRLKVGIDINLGPCDQALHAAFLTGIKIPKTQRHLYTIIR